MKTGWLEGKTVVVAGATGAIGQATCAEFLSAGATVFAVGRDPVKLVRLQADLEASPDRFHPLPVSFQDQGAWERVLVEVLRFSPGIDAYVHAAGQVTPGAFLELTEREIDSMIETNFRSAVAAAGALIPHMAERGTGHFIVVGSLGGIVPMPFETIYAATKFALRGFCLSLHEEVRPLGVTVSLVSPGPVRSPMLTREGSDLRAALTFVDAPLEPATIAGEIVGLLRSRTREIVRPPLQRFAGLLVSLLPGLFGTLFPLLTAIGRRKLSRYRRLLAQTQECDNDHSPSAQAA